MSTSFVRRFFGWLWQGEAVAQSREQIADKSRDRLRLERHAMTASEIADRALHPVTPLRSGPGETIAAMLYAQSIRACLRALDDSARLVEDPSLKDELARRLPGEAPIERVLEMLAHPFDAEELQDEMAVGSEEAQALGEVSRALLEIAREPERREQKALGRRVRRVGSVGLVLLAVSIGGAALGSSLAAGPDLAEGKTWRASSSYDGFSSERGICDGRRTRIFFHTKRENEPWVEIDLGSEMQVQRVDIQNRRDCCRDRAFPLAVEGSIDGQRWRELARHTEPFSKWTARFAATTVRYVRVKALKRTYFHLESVQIR